MTHVCHITNGCQILTSTHLYTLIHQAFLRKPILALHPSTFHVRRHRQKETNLLLIDWLLDIAKLPMISRS